MSEIQLNDTYAKTDIHKQWERDYLGNSYQSALNDLIAKRHIAYFKDRKNMRMLDAGCGTGEHLGRYLANGIACVAVDISHDILVRTRNTIKDMELDGHVAYCCQGLEHMSIHQPVFDAVLCRGVLMHIPGWKKALLNLCGTVKKNGIIILTESNHQSIESKFLSVLRKLKPNRVESKKTDDGIEFWTMFNDEPFLYRMANINQISILLRELGYDILEIFPTEFFDVARYPYFLRKPLSLLNLLLFKANVSYRASTGVCIIGRKL